MQISLYHLSLRIVCRNSLQFFVIILLIRCLISSYYFCVSQADNVYCEVLYSLMNAINWSGSDTVDQVMVYLKRTFQFDNAKHEELLASVSKRTVS